MRFSGLFFLLFACTAWAQVATLGPQTVYEGQSVVAVDLIANPHRDVEPLRPLLVQQEHHPYSQANVEASIAALEQKGGFPRVTVNVLPEPDGLRLNFLLEPAYYIGIVDFPGVIKVFSYTRLLQVVNLPDEDPYEGEEENDLLAEPVEGIHFCGDYSWASNMEGAALSGERAAAGVRQALG